MAKVFKDGVGKFADQHEVFEQWKRKHPARFVLHCKTQTDGVLHRPSCKKLNGPHQHPGEGKSRTKKAKICDDVERELQKYVAEHLPRLTIRPCKSCQVR